MSIPDLETLFTHPRFWGVETATPCQRAFCRIVEGRPLGDLAGSADVQWMVGGPEALAFLAPGGALPKQVSLYGAVRIGKSDMASCVAFRASQVIDLSPVREHEIPRLTLVSLTVDLGRVVFAHLLGRLHKPALRPLLVDEGADYVTVTHPSGRRVEIRVAAGARAGGSLVARWSAGFVADEKPRMLGQDDGVVNYPDALHSVEGRLLAGAQVIDVGSPWAPYGPAFDDVQQRWGKPSRHHVVLRMTGEMGNPTWWTPKRRAELREKNVSAYETDAMGNFAQTTGVTDIEALEASLVPRGACTPISRAIGLVDLSGGGEVSKNDTVCAIAEWCVLDNPELYEGEWDPVLNCTIVSRNGSPLKRKPPPPQVPFLRIRSWRAWKGGFGPHLPFERLVAEIAGGWKAEGVRIASGDQYEQHAAVSAFQRHGIDFRPIDWSKRSKESAADTLARWWAERSLWIDGGAETSRIRQECLTAQMRPAQGGGWKIGAKGNQKDDRFCVCLHAAVVESSGSDLLAGGPTATESGGMWRLGHNGAWEPI